jgi:outer membrane murein-binding lipoprotein Lpp
VVIQRSAIAAGALSEDRLDQAARAMAELAAQWDPRLGTIKRLAETAHAENKKRRRQRNDQSPDRHASGVARGER